MAIPLVRRLFGNALSNAAGYSIGGAVQPTLEPLTQDLANETWQLHAVKPLSASNAAEASLRGIMDDGDARQESAMTGYDSDRYAALRRLAANPPALDALLTLWRRNAITDEQLDRGLAQNGIHEEWRPRVKALAHVLPSVEDQVRFAVREAYDPASVERLDLDAEFPQAFADAAEMIGLDPSQAKLYWRAHWQLPSYSQATEMLFRGEITRTQFTALLKAQDYAPTWRAKLEAIARAIPTITDFQRLVRRGVYAGDERARFQYDAEYPAEFTAKMALHGMNESDARDLWAGGWRVVSAGQLYTMRHRGEITDADLNAGLKALDYSPFWRDRLFAISHRIPGRIDLKRFYRHGIYNEAELVAGYRRLGYADAEARNMADVAIAESTNTADGSPWANRARSRLYTVAHREFIDGSIDEAKARDVLAQVGAAAAEVPAILAAWRTEDAIGRAELTVAQIRKFHKEASLTYLDAHERLVDKGYTPDDADKLLGIS